MLDINDTLEELYRKQRQTLSLLNYVYENYFSGLKPMNEYAYENCGNIIDLSTNLLSNQCDILDNLITESLKLSSYDIPSDTTKTKEAFIKLINSMTDYKKLRKLYLFCATNAKN